MIKKAEGIHHIANMVHFSKYQGAGNDFIFVENTDKIKDMIGLAKKWCNRKFGIGADGLIAVKKAQKEAIDFDMQYYNPDGT